VGAEREQQTNETKWTPGPYRAENLLTPEGDGRIDVCAPSPTSGGKLRVVAENVRLEDAPLFVAAPEMHAVLSEGNGGTFAASLESLANGLVIADRLEDAPWVEWLRRKASEVRAVLAKADGGEA